jgi:hypothetical protein
MKGDLRKEKAWRKKKGDGTQLVLISEKEALNNIYTVSSQPLIKPHSMTPMRSQKKVRVRM